jgi:hypothetical protein
MKPTTLVALILGVGCVALGASTLYFAGAKHDLEAQLATRSTTPAPPTQPLADDPGGYRQALAAEASANAALRAELARLKGETKAPPAVPVVATPTAEPQPRNSSGGSWMERLRQEDPARFAQLQEERERRRQVAEEWYHDKLAALDHRAQTATTREEAELADQIANTLARAQELRAQWGALRDMPEEQRRTAIEQLQQETRDAYRQLHQLRDQDRQFQLSQLGQALGTDPTRFVESVTGIYKNTDYTPSRGGGWGGGPRWGEGGPASATVVVQPPR